MTTEYLESPDLADEGGFGEYAPPDLSSFNNPGELVSGRGTNRESDADYYAYSTILAHGLKPQSDTEIEFTKTAALRDPMQQLALDKHISWFTFIYNAPVANRYGLMELTERRIRDIVEGAEDAPEGERARLQGELEQAEQLAEDYQRAKARGQHLMSRSTAELSGEEISARREEWRRALAAMEQADGAATELHSGAREVYHHRLYILWVEAWIAEDERKGLPVAQYDFTALKEKFREGKATPLEEYSRMPLAWQKCYQMCQVSLSSGDEWRQMFVVAITRGVGLLPPPEQSRKKWYQRLGRRNPDPPALPPPGGMR